MPALYFILLSFIISAVQPFAIPEALYKPDSDANIFYPVVESDDDDSRDEAVIKAIQNIFYINSYTSEDAVRICGNVTATRKVRESGSGGADPVLQIQPQILALLNNENTSNPAELEAKIHRFISNHGNDPMSEIGAGDGPRGSSNGPIKGRTPAKPDLRNAVQGDLQEPSGDAQEVRGNENANFGKISPNAFKIQDGDVAVIEEKDGENIQVTVEKTTSDSHSEKTDRVARSGDSDLGFSIVEELTVGDDDDETSTGDYQEDELQSRAQDGEQAIDLRPDVLNKIIIAQHLAKRSSQRRLAEENVRNMNKNQHDRKVNVRRKRV